MKTRMNSDAVNLLRRAGLNQYESKVYLALLSNGPTTASDLSEIAGIPRPRAYDILTKLEKKGFISIQPGRPTKFNSCAVEEAFNSLKKHREREHVKDLEELTKLKGELKEHVKKEKIEAPKTTPNDHVWVMSDRSNIYSKIESLIANAQSSIMISSTPQGIQRKLETYGDSLLKAKERGVNVKIVSPEKIPHNFEHVSKKAHRMMIIDNDVVLFLTPEGNPKREIGAWIKSPFLAENLQEMMK